MMSWPIKDCWQSDDGAVTLYHGDTLEILPTLDRDSIASLVTDPPYGISYTSGMTGHNGGSSLPGIVGDEDTSLRDAVLRWWGSGFALVFGSAKVQKPVGCKMVLTWEKGDHVGMGDLSIPWKPNTEEIYVLGSGFSGHRGSSVLRFNAPVSWNSVRFGRQHPHEKPVDLMNALISKCPRGAVFDPFMGAGSTIVSAIQMGRRAVGIEIEPRTPDSPDYFSIAVERCKRELERFPLFEKPQPLRQRQRELAGVCP